MAPRRRDRIVAALTATLLVAGTGVVAARATAHGAYSVNCPIALPREIWKHLAPGALISCGTNGGGTAVSASVG
jgi:hypothetical protein